jgi:hypothetical protein
VKIYRDKNMSDQVFEIEESYFFDCTLKNCDLLYSGGDFQIVNLTLVDCRVHFRGPAKSTVALLQLLRMIPGPIQLPAQAQSRTTFKTELAFRDVLAQPEMERGRSPLV